MNSIDTCLNTLNTALSDALLSQQNKISEDIYNFIFAKSKQLRAKLIFLLAYALDKPINDKIISLASATELIHNSTLIHDDILDNAEFRRCNISLNKKLGNNLSVLAGDLLLSIAVNFLAKCNDINIFNVFSSSLRNMCEGEINQHFSKNTVPSLDDYIVKSEKKTAELFKASLCSLCYILETEQINNINNFAENFGIAFQIKDDLNNILKTDFSKPGLSDINNGIYSAPVIFLNEIQDVSQCSKSEIVKLIIENDEIKDKTNNLIIKYAAEAIASLQFIKDNQYKTELINLTKNIYEAI